MKSQIPNPTGAFIAAAWAALLTGMVTFAMGLWNSNLQLNEKGFYAMSVLLGLFGAISVQKNVRDLAAFEMDAVPIESKSDFAQAS
jgi:uncharacterized membrane protein YiaA